MQIVFIDSEYTDYLRKFDGRVSYNENITYQRPYVGVLLNMGEKKYFAPLTSGKKREKLKKRPLPENITFLPIAKNQYGGIHFNNMIPLVDGVFWAVDMNITSSDNDWQRNRKIMLQKQVRFIRKNWEHIITKAKFIYNLMVSGKLYSNQKKLVCDFLKLENAAAAYKKVGKK